MLLTSFSLISAPLKALTSLSARTLMEDIANLLFCLKYCDLEGVLSALSNVRDVNFSLGLVEVEIEKSRGQFGPLCKHISQPKPSAGQPQQGTKNMEVALPN
jgi:hypothetical protein